MSFITYPFLFLNLMLPGVAAIGCIHLAISGAFTEDYDDHGYENTIIIIWWLALGTSIVISIITTCLTIMLSCCLSSDEHKRQSQKRLQLAYLFLASLLLLESKIGALFGIPLLYIIPFLLFYIIFVLKRDSISGYYYEPDDTNV
jgi:hypothetical protein